MKTLTQNQWIHQMVEGYQIEFSTTPLVGCSCPPYKMDRNWEEALDQEVTNLINGRSQVGQTRFRQLNVCGHQEGRKMETNNQPEDSKSICSKTTFQNGGYQKSEGYHPGRRPVAKLYLKEAYFSVQ